MRHSFTRAAVTVPALMAVLGVASSAQAHGAASWIMTDVNTAYCCGVNDCERAPANAVRLNGDGYEVVSTGQHFAEGDRNLHWSRDQDWWWCRPDGITVKCLFRPQVSF